MNYFFLLAGGVSAFALVLHLMLGRRRPPPLAGAGADDRLDAFYGRHVTTALLAVMGLGYAHAAREVGAADLALVLSILALTASGLRLVFAIRLKAPRLDITEWSLIALAGALGLAGTSL
ncbi:MAG: hypothetical protein SGJ21_04810 [Alphaproteobacteria bacterium]|nr:hypothetical protein [Alphaproteobacteria bacterium]